jgi:hypothetical protein
MCVKRERKRKKSNRGRDKNPPVQKDSKREKLRGR